MNSNSKFQRILFGEVDNEKVTDDSGNGKRKRNAYGGGGDDSTAGRWEGENRRGVQFPHDGAHQCERSDDDESSDDYLSESDFETDEDDLFKKSNEPRKASVLPYVKEEQMSEEEFERMMCTRYKDCHNEKNSIDRDRDSGVPPSAKYPTMSEVKCKGNIGGANTSKLSTRNAKAIGSFHRVWTLQEEETLINALKDLIALGWKCGNGFRTGYLLCLEKALVKAFPSTDLRAELHIRSKIQDWEYCYDSLHDMLRRPGFTWSCRAKMIKVDKGKTWREYVKSNPFAEKMRFKTWPYYHHWCEIFGKERATLEKDQSKGNDARSGRNANDVPPVGEKGFTPVHQRSTNLTGNESKSTREESMVTTSAKLVEMMGAFCEATKSSFTELTKKISVDYDMQTQRKTVYEALGEIGQLSVAQRVHVAKLLVNNNNELDLFFSLPREARAEMVRQLIGEPCLMFSKF